MKSFIISVVVLFMFVLAFTFGAQNQELVTINYFIAEGKFQLSVVLSVTFFAGFLLSWLFAFFYILKLKIQLTYAQSKLNKTEISKNIEKKTAQLSPALTN